MLCKFKRKPASRRVDVVRTPAQCQAKEMGLIVCTFKADLQDYSRFSVDPCVIANHANFCGSKCSRVGLSLINVRNCTNAPMSLLHASCSGREVSRMVDTSQRKSYSPGAVRILSSAPAFRSEPSESLIETCIRNRRGDPVTVRCVQNGNSVFGRSQRATSSGRLEAFCRNEWSARRKW